MKTKGIRLLAAMMALIMVVGILAALPISTSAWYNSYNNNDQAAEGTGTPLPEGAVVYDGTPSETLEGEGTVDAPYIIKDAADFIYFRNSVAATATADTYVKLTGDIYMNDENYGTKGKENSLSEIPPDFAGVLDGDGHTIYNIYTYITTHENRYYGIFKSLTGTVKNLNLDGFRLVSSWTDMERHRGGTIACSLTGTGKVENVNANNIYVKMNSYAGGIVGEMTVGTSITNCTVSGTMVGSAGNAGGVVGQATGTGDAPVIQNCTSDVNLTGKGSKAHGGILGYASCKVLISDCASYGDFTLTAASQTGGIVGHVTGAATGFSIDRCYNYGDITSVGSTGGIFGGESRNEPLQLLLTDCANYGDISGTTNVGGIGGVSNCTSEALSMTNCVNYGDVTGTNYVGGILGKAGTGGWGYSSAYVRIYNCATFGDITATTAGAGFVAGQASTVYSNAIINVTGLVATGTVTAPTKVAAIVGEQTASTNAANAIALEKVFIDGTLVATADDGQVAVFNGDCNIMIKSKKVKVDQLDENGDPVLDENGAVVQVEQTQYYVEKRTINVTATNCGFNLKDKNGNDITVGWYGTQSSGEVVDVTNKDAVTATAVKSTNIGYTDGKTKITDAAYPAADAAIFTNGDLVTTMTNFAKEKGYTIWIQSKTAPTPVTTLGFTGATMTLGGAMALNIKLATYTTASLKTEEQVTVAFVDETGSAVVASADDVYHTVTYAGIRAADMAKDMKIHPVITVGTTTYVSSNVLTYSPATYLTNLYTQYADDAEIIAVVENMLAYGAVAEANEAGIADLTATATAAAAAAAGITTLPTDFTYTQDQYTVADVMTQADKDLINAHATTGVGATLTGGITLSLNGMTPGDTVTVSFRDVSETYTAGDDGIIVIDTLHAGLLLDTITLTFTDGTARIALGNYLDARMADSELLAKATINYMMAVYAYMLTH